jgi:glycosyltransferase involved in cell wall biosynthesis
MRPPRVSIVIPTHNRGRLLGRSLRSLLAQTEPRFEIIVVDDASTDDTAAVVRSLSDARIRYQRLERNCGPGGARNAGVRAASGELLAFQDSDDEWMPDKLERQLALLSSADSSTGVVYCDMLRVHADGSTPSEHHSPKLRRGRWIEPRTGFYAPYGLGIQTCLMRREAFESVGGFVEELRCFEDLELFLRLLLRWEFRLDPRPLVRYHETGGGQTTKWAEELRARRYIVRRHAAALLRQAPGFWLRESVLGGFRSLLAPIGGRFPGRPSGPPPRDPEPS